MALQILPSIDLRDGRVVRLKQGDYARQLNYDVDAIATAQAFADAGARWIHIVDLDGAKAGQPVQSELIAKIIAGCGLQVEVGGGVREVDHIQRLIDVGASRVVVGTRAVEDWRWFESISARPELSGRLVLALDARDGIVATRGWTQVSGVKAIDIATRVTNWPLAGILYTDVARDGMLGGPNIEQTRALAEAGAVPVIASGGVGNLDHVRRLGKNSPPIWGVVIGRSIYEGALDLREAIKIADSSHAAR